MQNLPSPSNATFSESSFWNLGRIVAGINVVLTIGLAALWYSKKDKSPSLAKIPGKIVAAMVGLSLVVAYFSFYYPKVAYIYGVWVLFSGALAGGMSIRDGAQSVQQMGY